MSHLVSFIQITVCRGRQSHFESGTDKKPLIFGNGVGLHLYLYNAVLQHVGQLEACLVLCDHSRPEAVLSLVHRCVVHVPTLRQNRLYLITTCGSITTRTSLFMLAEVILGQRLFLERHRILTKDLISDLINSHYAFKDLISPHFSVNPSKVTEYCSI